MTAHRRADMDGLRVIAIFLLLVFHTGMVFNPWPFHIKNPELLKALELPMEVLHVVRMPLLMVIAGMGTALALERRSTWGFAKERLLRLGLPLLAGMLLIVPPQIYIERILVGQSAPLFLDAIPHAGFEGSFFSFWPTVFQLRPYPAGNLSWHHLWFVAYLLVYCLALLPLLAWSRTPRGHDHTARFAAWLGRGSRVLWLFLPLGLVRYLLRHFPETHALVDDPKVVLYYALLFGYGHLFGRFPELMARLVALRYLALGLGVLLFAGLLPEGAFPAPFEHLAVQAFAWCLILASLGFAHRHWTLRRPWLAYAQEIAFPFYILHQTVIVLVAFALRESTLHPWPKLGLVLLLSFFGTWAGCELVRRVRGLRPWFGLKGRPRETPQVAYPAPHEA